jgi:photosystem II stability/assembly factor-like uncharacterized protein
MKNVILFLIFAMAQTAFSQWQSCENQIYGGDIKAIALHKNEIVVCTKGGVFFSNDLGSSWTTKNEGLFNTMNTITTDGVNIYAGSLGGGIYISAEKGNNWIQKNEGLTNDTVNTIALKGDNVFIGTNGGVHCSHDKGESWIPKISGLTNLKVISLSVFGNKLYAGTERGVFISSDDGETWANTPSKVNFPIKAIAVNENYIIVVTDEEMFISNDNGENWKKKIILDSKAAIITIKMYEDKVIAGTSGGGVFVSTDMCENWVSRSGGLSSGTISAMAIEDSLIFVGTSGSRVYKSNLAEIDGKPSFSFISDFSMIQDSTKTIYFKVPSYASEMVITKQSDNSELIPTDSIKIPYIGDTRSLTISPVKGKYGVCIITLSVTNGTEPAEVSFTVTVFKGMGVVENPKSDNQDITLLINSESKSLTIDFLHNSSELTKIKLYSLSGNLVDIIYSAVPKPKIEYSTTNLPVGVYFVTIESESLSFTKKIILE